MRFRFAICLVLLVALVPAAWSQEEEKGPVHPALLVIDVQEAFLPMMDANGRDSAMQTINGYIWLFRQHGFPVIRVYHTDPKWGPAPDSPGFPFPDAITVQESDPKIVKHYPSAFVDTELDATLKEMGVNTLFLCGLSATGCVLATYFGAMERHYDMFMIEGALLSPSAEQTKAITEILESVGWTSTEVILRAAAQ